MSKHTIGERDGSEGSANKKQKVVLPTKDEQKQLQQVELLMKSNLLQIQVDQILEEVSGDPILGKKKVASWVESIIGLLKDDASYNGIKDNAISRKTLKKSGLKMISIMSLVNAEDDSLQINFAAPESVDLIGSTENHTALSSMFNVDVAITMPASLFESRYA